MVVCDRVPVKGGTAASTTPLAHHVHHSPDGFAWGYHGSGPAELARCLLWDHLGEEPARSLYQDFKAEVVATWGDEWEITSDAIQGFIDAWHPVVVTARQEARR